jgi:hypothetical protein
MTYHTSGGQRPLWIVSLSRNDIAEPDTKTPPGAQPSGVLKTLDRLFPGINLDTNKSIAKANLVASSVLSSNDGGGSLALQGVQD